MLQVIPESKTMSSREIAELTGKRHDNVMRDIRVMLNELHGAGGALTFEDTYTNPKNAQVYAIFNLPKDETLCLMSGYDIKARMTIIKRWQELENKTPALPSYPEALRALAGSLEREQEHLALIEQQKPSVEFVERYVEARSSKCLSDVAKILKWKPREFIKALADNGVLFKRGGAWIPHQCHIDAGRFTVTTGEGNGHAYHQTRVEPDGVVWLAKNYKQE
jgi:Rha family phage regulatory protein